MYLSKIPLFRLPAMFSVLVLALCGTVAQANDIIACKAADPTAPVPAGTSFSFTITTATDAIPFSLTVGGTCVEFRDIGAGPQTIRSSGPAKTVRAAVGSGEGCVGRNGE